MFSACVFALLMHILKDILSLNEDVVLVVRNRVSLNIKGKIIVVNDFLLLDRYKLRIIHQIKNFNLLLILEDSDSNFSLKLLVSHSSLRIYWILSYPLFQVHFKNYPALRRNKVAYATF